MFSIAEKITQPMMLAALLALVLAYIFRFVIKRTSELTSNDSSNLLLLIVNRTFILVFLIALIAVGGYLYKEILIDSKQTISSIQPSQIPPSPNIVPENKTSKPGYTPKKSSRIFELEVISNNERCFDGFSVIGKNGNKVEYNAQKSGTTIKVYDVEEGQIKIIKDKKQDTISITQNYTHQIKNCN